jgi:hypothetical protein
MSYSRPAAGQVEKDARLMNEKREDTMTNWVRHTDVLFDFEAGGLTLIVENRSDRNLSWCWNVKVLGCFSGSSEPGETIWLGAGEKTASAAMKHAESYARRFCEQALEALAVPDERQDLRPEMPGVR